MLLALEQSWPGALLNQGHVIGIIFYSFFFFPSGTTGASCLFAIKHMEILVINSKYLCFIGGDCGDSNNYLVINSCNMPCQPTSVCILN